MHFKIITVFFRHPSKSPPYSNCTHSTFEIYVYAMNYSCTREHALAFSTRRTSLRESCMINTKRCIPLLYITVSMMVLPLIYATSHVYCCISGLKWSSAPFSSPPYQLPIHRRTALHHVHSKRKKKTSFLLFFLRNSMPLGHPK